eukprot:m.1181405 g.1181405  ORF g.1181405 m.1181405 type:complete len:419 (-) comp24534_c0_seq7:4496-5752(-)
MVYKFVYDFCVGESWDANRYDGFYFGEYTPCFNDIVIISATHLTFFVFAGVRLKQLLSNSTPKVKKQGRTVYVLRCVAATIATLCPAFELTSKLASVDTGSHSDPYGNESHLLPFEYASLCVLFVAYLLVTIICCIEVRFTVLRGQWIMRFISLFGFAALSIRVIFFVQLNQKDDDPFRFFALNFFAMYGAVGTLVLIAILYWPSHSAYTELEYRLMPVAPPQSLQEAQACLQECPEARAGLWSTITFSWMTPMISLGYKRPLENSDVWKLSSGDHAQQIRARFQKQWSLQTSRPNPRMVRALVQTFFPMLVKAFIYKAFNDASQFVGPIFLKALIKNTSEGGSLVHGFIFVFAMVAGQIVGTVSWYHVLRWTCVRVGRVLPAFRTVMHETMHVCLVPTCLVYADTYPLSALRTLPPP